MDNIHFIIEKAIKGFGIAKIGDVYFFMYLSLTMCLFLIDYLVEGWQNSSARKVMVFKKSTQADFFLYLLQIFRLFYVFEFILTLGISHLPGLINKYFHFEYNLVSWFSNQYISFLLLFFIYDFIRYWIHRLFHRITFLWELHGYHHAAEEMTIFTHRRFHFFELSINRFLLLLPNILLGSGLFTTMLVFFMIETIEILQHSSIKSDWGFIGKYVLFSPNQHRIHHSIDAKHYNKNFGIIFVFWDKIFNTHHPKETIIEIGLPNNPYNKNGFVQDMYLVIINFLKALRKAIDFPSKSSIKN
jgi:sterol desaturase/sphingolipid hydroxylase (fatty acid hydroxylase superfamily)